MERLDIQEMPGHPNIEAAIHFARYAVAKNWVKDKRVLDIACGEGYGSYLLKQAGAESVVGIDISNEAIQKAQQIFGGNQLSYLNADATQLATLFRDQEFDLVISIETIEHVADAPAFLAEIRRITKPEGIIIISCPNDHWYYPDEKQSNPYHRQKYHLEEFQALSTAVLGDKVQWSLGTGVFGFGSTPLSLKAYDQVPESWMSYVETNGAYLINGKPALNVPPTQSSYYIGIWNAPSLTTGTAVFPLPMDEYAKIMNVDALLANADEKVRYAEEKVLHAEEQIHALQNEARVLGLKFHALQAERAAMLSMRPSVSEANLVEFRRYQRIKQRIPVPIRSLMIKTLQFIRR